MTNEELKKKIVGILNKNFTEEWVVTPVYTTNDGKEIELPQELCEIFNDIVVQAVIPYFADALIAAGIGDIQDIREKANLDISGTTSNPTQYTGAPADPQEPKIKKWYRNTVGHEPANYDAAALKAYIAHLEAENAELQEKDINCVNSVDEMIAMCDKCGLFDCCACEHSYTAVQGVKELKRRAEVAERALRNAAPRLKCRGGLGEGFCGVDKCDYYHCNNDEGCVKAHLQQAEKELAEEGKE